jgi:hypothetical protein
MVRKNLHAPSCHRHTRTITGGLSTQSIHSIYNCSTTQEDDTTAKGLQTSTLMRSAKHGVHQYSRDALALHAVSSGNYARTNAARNKITQTDHGLCKAFIRHVLRGKMVYTGQTAYKHMQTWWSLRQMCSHTKSLPPPWMSITGPMSFRIMAEHSTCQPGRPGPQGLSHVGSPGFAFFHKTKSAGCFFLSSTATLSLPPAIVWWYVRQMHTLH